MRAWRLQRAVYPVLDGEGARRHGGRWNTRGHPVVYAASTLSLASLELLVHLDPDLVPADLRAYEIDVPDTLRFETLDPSDLPPDWRAPENEWCKTVGDVWIARARVPLLRVPSVIVPEEHNILINPAHPGAARVSIATERAFAFDPRLSR